MLAMASCAYERVPVCVVVCVCEREMCVCVCVCVCAGILNGFGKYILQLDT